MVPAYLSLSSALPVPELIYQAIDQLQSQFGDIKVSSLYRTADKNGSNQLYYNACLLFYTDLSPSRLKQTLKAFELKLGRNPKTPADQHLIDMDLLLLGDQVFESGNIQLPHPDLLKHEHVLIPMIELEPTLMHPTMNAPLNRLRVGLR